MGRLQPSLSGEAALQFTAWFAYSLGDDHAAPGVERPRLPWTAANAALPLPPDPNDALVRRVKSGDDAALGALLDAVAPRVFRVVCGVIGRTHPDVDDVTQVALVEVLKGVKTFRHECLFSGFASRIALRIAIRARRRRLHREKTEQNLHLLSRVDIGERSESLLVQNSWRLWRRLLDELPAAQSEVLALHVLLGHSLDETAAATGAPFNTVRSRLRLAVEHLRRRIQGDPSLADLWERT